MANHSHFIRRRNELQHITDRIGRMEQEIDDFLRTTTHIIQSKAAVELDSQKMQETQHDLMQLESRLLDYKSRLRQQVQVKVRQWERPQLSGQAGNVRGERRKVERKLNQSLDRIKQIRANLSLVSFSNQGITLEQTGKQLDNLVGGDGHVKVGAEWLLGVTLLLAFFNELKRKWD